MKRICKGFLRFTALCLGTISAQATIITYDVVNIFGNTYEYNYTVQNDTLSVDIEEVVIFFDVSLFENLDAPSAPTDWDPVVIQPDTVLQDDGFYDAFALAFGIASGDSLGGFTVRADVLGFGTPGAQPFEIRDPVSFDLLDSGFTVLAGAIAVPEPASIWLITLGLGALTVVARQRRKR